MRERKANEFRELEGIVRQLQKRLKQLTKENAKLRKELNKREMPGFEDPLPEVSKKVEKRLYSCINCGHDDYSVVELNVGNKKLIKFQVCRICKTRARMA
jgi:predicted nuclease with TOPRIM domain